MSNWLRFVSMLSLCVLMSLPLVAQDQITDPPSQALLEDAASYATLFDVSLEEAVHRLRLQVEAGALAAILAEEETQDFAGLWIEHEPQFQVIARFRSPAADRRLQERLVESPLAGLVEVRSATHSLAQLEQRLTAARHLVDQLGFRADLSVDVFENRVNVFTVDSRGLSNALEAARVQLPSGVEIVEVSELTQPIATLVGATPGSTCTGGFTVRHSTGELGISTAAHCGNSQSFMSTSLPFRSEDQQGNQDVQWHSACDIFDVSNEFDSGISLRACTGTRSRSQQAIGALVWKNGMTSGRTFGKIESKTFAPWWVSSAASTFIYVDGDSTGMDNAEPGDSGSPVFVEDLAYGILIGENTTNFDAIYMPINYISSLGVSVLTSNPGPGCNLRPVASFNTTLNGNSASFDASASQDPDGSIVSYHWSFGDGTSTTTTSPTTSHFYSSGGSYAVQLTVTDNEGATDTAFDFIFIPSDCGSRICIEEDKV